MLVPAGGRALANWSTVLHPAERSGPSKTQEFDKNLMFDFEGGHAVGEMLGALASRRIAIAPLFRIGRARYFEAFRQAGRRLGLRESPTPYQLRQRKGGRNDFAAKRRDLNPFGCMECRPCLSSQETSLMWSAPHLRRRAGVHMATTEICMWGAPWRRPTSFLGFRADVAEIAARRCPGHRRCRRTGQPHARLRGHAPKGSWRNAAAARHPRALCQELATVFARVVLAIRAALSLIRLVYRGTLLGSIRVIGPGPASGGPRLRASLPRLRARRLGAGGEGRRVYQKGSAFGALSGSSSGRVVSRFSVWTQVHVKSCCCARRHKKLPGGSAQGSLRRERLRHSSTCTWGL